MRNVPGSPLRIALDVGPLHGHRTGIGEAVAGLTEVLERRRDVEVVRYLVSRRAAPSPGERKLPLPGLVASHLWSRSDRPRADRWLRDIDVVHGTNYVVPPTSHPAVVSVYDCWFLRHPSSATPAVRRAGKRLRRAVERGAWVHTSSDATAEQVRELLATDRVTTVHLGPPSSPTDATDDRSTPRPIDGVPLDVPYVLAIGTEERRKDLSLLVRAFDDLGRSEPELRLILAGAPGDDSEAISAAMTDLGTELASRIHRLGPVDPSTKQRLLSGARVVAYPSLDEGFGFPILEAQRHGVPVVATDVGSVAEVAGDGVVLVEGRDAGDFARALSEAISSEELRRRVTEAGRCNLARFSWDRTIDGLVDLYRFAHEAHEESDRAMNGTVR